MFNRYGRFPQLPFWAKVGEIPTSYKVAMSYEEQLLWLCHEVEKIKGSSGNIDYNALENKPSINGVTLQGSLSLNDLDIQQKLRAGNGIIIDGNIISATGGGGTGGTDNYELLKNKPSINGVTLIGDKSFSDLGLQTTKVYTEVTNYVSGYYYDILGNNVFIGDQIPRPTENANSCYLAIDKNDCESYKFRITGDSYTQIWFTCTSNPLIEGSLLCSGGATASESDPWQLRNNEIEVNVPEEAQYIVFSFNNINNVTPKIEVVTETISGGTTDYEELNNKPQINGVTLIGNKSFEDLGLVTSKSYEELTNYVEDYYYPSFFEEDVFIGDEIPQPEEFINTSFIVIDKQTIPSTSFRVTGDSISQIWFTCSDNPTLNTSILRSVGTSGSVQSPIHFRDTEIIIDVPSNANFIVFNFTNTGEITPKVEVITETISASDVKNLEANLDLNEGQPISLATGFYNTGVYKVRHLTLFETEDWIGNYELFYVANNSTIISDNFNIALIDDGNSINWTFVNHSGITNTIENDDTMIPTSKAVYDALQNVSGTPFYTELADNVIFNMDGTTTPALNTGFYYVKNKSVKYYRNNNLEEPIELYNVIFHYDNTAKYLYVITDSGYLNITLSYSSSTTGWYFSKISESNFVRNATGTSSTLRTSIPASSNDNDVGNINAVRNYVQSNNANYSTTEKVVGTWIDGKPIYQRTLEINYTMTNGSYSGDIDVSSYNISFMVNIESLVQKQFSATNFDFETTWYWTESDKCRIFYRKSNTSDNETLRIRMSGTNTGGKCYITLKYTKTTD